MGNSAYYIKTDRLLLRCFEPKDAYDVKAAIDESGEHLLKWMAWAKHEPEDIEIKINRMKKYRAEFDLGNNYVYGIFLHECSKFIGTISLMKRIGDNALEIGYWLHVNYINHGYITEAASALVKVAFEIEKVDRVEIHCDINNGASAAIPYKLGFNKEAIIRENDLSDVGIRKKSIIWVLFKEEYETSILKNLSLSAIDAVNRKIL